jgi:hypothetical protein
MAARQPKGRNESAEGKGNARRRWFEYLSELDPRLLDISGFLNVAPTVWERHGNKSRSPQDEYFDAQAAKHVKEAAELIGFWVAWHTAGGFDLLEERGWNRATIYRRIKAFREHFGAHPDEFQFGWLKLDVAGCWNEDLYALTGQGEES